MKKAQWELSVKKEKYGTLSKKNFLFENYLKSICEGLKGKVV